MTLAIDIGPLDPKALERGAAPALGPFTVDRLLLLVVVNIAGITLVTTGWWMASGLSHPGPQIAWVNVSLLGLLVAGAANGVWLAQGRRAVTLARAAVLPAPRRDEGPTRSTAAAATRAADLNVGALVTGPGMTRYHRASCALVAGKAIIPADSGAHQAAGLDACEVCRP
jgi:hypothetical protein